MSFSKAPIPDQRIGERRRNVRVLRMQIDHVLYGVQDLDAAATWFEGSFGLSAVSGGAHPAWGTANAILPVGDGQYVELIAVVDRASGGAIFLEGVL